MDHVRRTHAVMLVHALRWEMNFGVYVLGDTKVTDVKVSNLFSVSESLIALLITTKTMVKRNFSKFNLQS